MRFHHFGGAGQELVQDRMGSGAFGQPPGIADEVAGLGAQVAGSGIGAITELGDGSLEVPVISTEVGMVPTFLEGSSLIVPVGDVAALSEAILRWESDMERFQAEANEYRQRLQREFGRDVLTAEVVECYQQLARRGQP